MSQSFQINRIWIVLIAIAFGLALTSGASLLAVQAAPLLPQGNIYVVTRTDDPSGSGSIGNLSLRQAVLYANADPGSTIRLAWGANYILTILANGNDGTAGALEVITNTTFSLPLCFFNCPAATIQGGPSWNDRLLYIAPHAQVNAYSLNFTNGNITGGAGGAIYLDQGSMLTLTDSLISNNSAANGGGIVVGTQGTLILDSSQVLTNTATMGGAVGGGIWNSGGTVVITDGLVSGNHGDVNGAGIASEVDGTLSLSNTVVSGNTTTQAGGGIYVSSGRVTLINSQVSNNAANGSTQNGGGIMIKTVGGTAYMTLTNTAITTNTASYEGGGIAVWPDFTWGGNTYLTINGGTMSGNHAHQGGGAMEFNANIGTSANQLVISGTQIMFNGSDTTGSGGLDLSSGAYTVTIANSVIDQNQTGTSGSGGGLYSNGNLSIVNTDISGNQAGKAGGGYYNSGGVVSIRNSTIDYNTVLGTNNNLSTGGGGVFNYGTLTLDNVNIEGNVAWYGSAGGLLNRSSATINNSTIAGNAAITLTGGLINTNLMTLDHTTISHNTGAYDAGVRNLGTLTIAGGDIRNNTATSSTAGLDNWGTLNATGLSISNNRDLTGYGSGLSNSATAWLTDSQIISNAAPLGWSAGIDNETQFAHLTLLRAAVLSNTATAAAGIYNSEGTLTATFSTIAHNVATGGPGGGILNSTYNWGPGWGVGSLRMDSSTVYDNSASDQGGGIYNSHIMTITNSTISGNRAATSGGGIYSEPGDNLNPSAYLNNVTIANNKADSNNDGTGKGGGVAIVSSTVSIRNTLIGQNNDVSGQAPDCSGVLTSDRYNLVQVTTGCALSGNLIGNIIGQNPLLGPLQNNGGSTWTHALLSGSPAINAGNPTTPGSGPAACLPTDQRGITRPVGSACDIGTYEYSVALKVYLPLVLR